MDASGDQSDEQQAGEKPIGIEEQKTIERQEAPDGTSTLKKIFICLDSCMNDKDPSNPIISDKNEGEYTNPDGTIFAVIGTAGADLHNFTGQAPYVVEQFQRFGFLDVNITSDGKIMKGTFYENRDGTDKDHFTITK